MMTALALRPYQQECLSKIVEGHNNGIHRQLCSLSTGAGKTVIFASLLKQMQKKSLILAHTTELLDQAKDKLAMVAPDLRVGLLNADSKDFDAPILISTIQSARQEQNLQRLQRCGFEVCIYDECHRSASDSSKRVLDALDFGAGTKRLLVGFTATAFRQDGRGLGEVFDSISYEKNVKSLIQEGYLCPPRGVRIETNLDFSLVKRGDEGDFQAESLGELMDVVEIRELVVDAYIKEGEGRQAICFGVTVQHAANLAALFTEKGVPSGYVHGGMAKTERVEVLRKYRTGKIRVLCNCQVLTEGFDAPETACVIIARPTQSKGLYQQMAGRGLRLWPNKRDCLILDFCTKKHSLCNSAILMQDAEEIEASKRDEGDGQKGLMDSLPLNLNQKLKIAIAAFDPIGESFTWSRDKQVYALKGAYGQLEIQPTDSERFMVVLSSEKNKKIIADNLNFEYAFAAGEDFARANRAAFAVTDRSAAWRDLPASEKQVAFIRGRGFRAGLDKLTRGQAADLIGSGALKKK
jgi:ATP-dependent helicase IRC3